MSGSLAEDCERGYGRFIRDLLILAIHLLVTLAKLLRPGGARTVVAESMVLKQQLLVINRSRARAPHLTTLDRFALGLTTLFIRPHRIPKLAAILKPATLFKFHKALVERKYRLLFHPVPGELLNHSARSPCRAVLRRIASVAMFGSCAIC